MYAIMGATGQTGGAAIAALLSEGRDARAILRDPAKGQHLAARGAALAVAATDDVAALAASFTGAEAVFVLNPPQPHAADYLGAARAASESIATAVRRSGVARVVALSSQGAHLAEGTGAVRTLYDFEHALRQTGAQVTFLRATYFMENWAEVLAPVREAGVLPSMLLPLDAAIDMVSVRDIGRVAASLLVDPGRHAPIVNLIGPRAYAPTDAAAAFAELLGRPVEAVPVPRDAWHAALTDAGLGEDYAAAIVALNDAINAGTMPYEPGVGETLRGTVTLREALAALLAAEAATPASASP
ncbi:NmrA family NAD(P)-binding protein [Elioraea sp.]|uniref:NmrA family NAD(P)-binding protein n=1 Tax=Elioraea sp. TaxID=2185103 RepID=UPI003F6FC0EF